MDKPRGPAFISAMHTSTIALLDGLGGPELIVIAVVVLLLFGSKRMPEIGRGIGRAIREFKRATSGVEENIREVLYDEPARPTLRPPAQRRPHRDVSVHQASTSAPPPAAPATAAASSSVADLNEPAPLDSETNGVRTEAAPETSRRDGDSSGAS